MDTGEKRLRIALEQIIALRGYKGEDMGRVAGYRLAAEIAEEALRFYPPQASCERVSVAGYRRRLPQYSFEHYEFEQPGYANPNIADWEALYAAPQPVLSQPDQVPQSRLTAQYWRDDAIEAAALIADRYCESHIASDIRALKSSTPVVSRPKVKAGVTLEMIQNVVEAELDDVISNSNGGAPSAEKQKLLDADKVEAWAAIHSALCPLSDIPAQAGEERTEKPIAHLVWLQGRRGPDDVEDYYEVARKGDKSVDGSEPFPVYDRPSVPAEGSTDAD